MPGGASNQILNRRLKPCQRCRIQRRKCDRSSENSDCYRCIKSNRDCIYDDGTGDIGDESIDGNMELQKLTQNVASLQESLQKMELYLQQERLAQANSQTNPALEKPAYLCERKRTSPLSSIHAAPYSVYINNSDSTSSSLQLSTIAPPMSTPSSNELATDRDSRDTSAMHQDEGYEWELTFVDGKLRLESTIRTFDELTAYGNALRQYLSPFAGVFNNTAFLFETIQPKSLVPMVIQVISQGSYNRQRMKLLTSNTSMLNKYHFMLKRHHPAVLLTAAGKEPPISCIDELVQNYFTCYNPGLPMIHAPSYLAEYETVVRPNPTQHAITMAFCCCICASTCRHLPYNNYERRILADYFYERAVDLLGDFFDDPDRRLETLMVINFISQYQQMTLRVAEGRKWCTIGHMIAKELYQEYDSRHMEQSSPTVSSMKEPSSPLSVASTVTTATTATSTSTSSSLSSSSSSFSAFPSTTIPTVAHSAYSAPTDHCHSCATTPTPMYATPSSTTSTRPESTFLSELSPTTTDRDFAIFRRHYAMSLITQKLLNLILDRNPETWELLSSRSIPCLEDESEMTRNFIGVYNKALQLMTHPVVLELKEQTHRMQLGEKAKVTLELILRFDQVYKDWWKSLPPEFRLCDQDPADVSCRAYIEKCPDQLKLIVFLLAVIHKAEANIALTKPANQSSISDDADLGLVRAIQERALNDAYECVESLALAMKKLESNKVYCIFTSDLLLWISDLMCTLSASPSASVKSRAQQRLMESLRALQTVQFMEGNLVPPSLSPLAYMYSAAESSSSSTSTPQRPKLGDPSINIVEMYKEYTLPALAFGYDILRMAAENQ